MRVDVKRLLKNYGILFAFFLVCLGVLVLRVTHPALPRPFRPPVRHGNAAGVPRPAFKAGGHEPCQA